MVEQVDVKCSRCNESCYGEVINTYGKYYHQYCFSCIVAGCNHDLARVGYFLIDDELYCSNDYRKLNGVKCAGCSKYVEGEAISVIDFKYHPTCFGCISCGKVFPAGAEVCFDGEDFFCLSCNISPKSVNVEPPEEKEPAKNEDEKIRNDNVDAASSTKCAGCENYIKTGQALLALDKQWHLWCFTCFKCGALLTGEYMGRDGTPYCEKDYQAEFGITCAGCGEYITGKVLQAGEKHYHPSCSRCAKCGEMFGEGEDMYLQGNEIWHPHCSEEQVVSDLDESDISKSEYDSECPSPVVTPKKNNESEPDTVTPDTPNLENGPENVHPTNLTPVPANLNPIPYGKPPGFRSVKPPGFRSVKPPEPVNLQASESVTPQAPVPAFSQPKRDESSDDESDDAPPPVPPPPARSASNQWREKYATASGVRVVSPKVDEKPSRPLSCAETLRPENDEKGYVKNSLTPSYSTTSLNSNSSGSGFQKGIGFNKLQHRINSQKDVRPVKFPTHIDPDRLRQFLNDPEHNVYLEDHEFYDLFKMTRQKFYSLPQAKKQELKSGILFC